MTAFAAGAGPPAKISPTRLISLTPERYSPVEKTRCKKENFTNELRVAPNENQNSFENSELGTNTERSALNAENWTLDQWSGRVLIMETRQYILFGILQHLYTQTEKSTSVRDLALTLAVSEDAVRDGLVHLEGKSLAAASALCAARRARCAA